MPQRMPTTPNRRRAVRILARSMFRDLTAHGYSVRDIVGVATALIGEVATHMAAHRAR